MEIEKRNLKKTFCRFGGKCIILELSVFVTNYFRIIIKSENEIQRLNVKKFQLGHLVLGNNNLKTTKNVSYQNNKPNQKIL
jgi:hypothetical protein